MESSRRPLSTATGIALIVLPLVAWGLKFFSFGWMMVIVLYGPIFALIAGYAVQIVIAVQGFIGTRDPIWRGAVRIRATVAAWATSIGAVLLGIFMPDGGDTGYGSTLQVWLGAYSDPEGASAMHEATDRLTEMLAQLSAAVWIAGFLWLLVEWVAGLVRRRRARSVLG